MKLTGNTILITGGGTGVGLEAAKLFSEKGNHVIVVARNAERLTAEAAKLKNTTAIACDLADEHAVRQLAQTIKQEHPALNLILLNAGLTHNFTLFENDNVYEEARQEMTTNYLSAILLTKELEPLLRDKPAAAFIITTSGAALVPDMHNPTYSATKAALHSLALSMRLTLEKKKSRVRVFEVMLPLVDTPFAREVKSDVKMPALEAAAAILAGLERDELEMHIGLVDRLYQLYLKSPQEALTLVNEMTGS